MNSKKNEENLEKKRESFIFYRSFYESIKDLDDKKRLKMYDSIANFALNFEENNKLCGICKQLFILIKPQIIANNKRFEDGLKGGRPKKIKTTGYENEKTTGYFSKKTNVNVNDNVNVNVDVNENKNFYGTYKNVHLTTTQLQKLLNLVNDENILEELINQLSEKIEMGKENFFDETKPNAHFIRLKKYYEYYKPNQDNNYLDDSTYSPY